MPVVVPIMTTRTRTAPVAELSNVMAHNLPPRLPKPAIATTGGSAQLARKKSYASLHSNALLHGRASLDKKSSSTLATSAIPVASHQRALELLRSVLATVQGPIIELELSQTVDSIVAESIEPAARAFWSLTLDERRATFIEALHQLQHPHADVIGSLNLLLCNRVAIGLLDPVSASDYSTAQQRAAAAEAAAAACNGAVPIAIADLTPRCSAAYSLSSSFDSSESETTLVAGDDVDSFDLGISADQAEQQTAQGLKRGLVEMWANGGFWRGMSARPQSSSRRASSVHTVAAEEPAKPVAMTDHTGACWPLDDVSKDVARSWGRFYADLGGVRVPTRFRVPHHSLAMLATEQLMMRNDKIVCPLKNRLQEANPRRQLFEDYIHATGTIPVQARHARLHRSPLHNSATI
ncbi:hypothetical protein GGI20_001911 [Coemansia sp. BCRC 34301]|nr:hypothetical protein GGI20_001911 [Coemansia sp. BCRC 34301]